MLYQDDDFGQGGLAGIKDEVSPGSIVSAQPYQPGVTTLAPQITAIKSKNANVLVDFTVPIYTAIGQLTSFTLGFKPQLVVSIAQSKEIVETKGGVTTRRMVPTQSAAPGDVVEYVRRGRRNNFD